MKLMDLKEEETEIDGIKVSTTQFAAMKAFGLLAKLAKALGPAVMSIVQSQTLASANLISPDVLAPAFGQIDPDQATRLVPEILASTACVIDGREYALSKKENIDIVFSGRLMAMFKTIGHALKVNYADFGLGSDPAAPQVPAPSAA